jgi:hypothetical protein
VQHRNGEQAALPALRIAALDSRFQPAKEIRIAVIHLYDASRSTGN